MNNPSSSSSSLPISGNDGGNQQQQEQQTSTIPRPPSSSSSSTPQQQQQQHQYQPKKGIFEHIMSNNSNRFVLSSSNYSYKEALHRPVPLRNSNNNNNQYALDHITRTCLPYPMVWTPTAGPGQMPPDFSWFANSCGGKAAIGVFGGGIMGLLMGVFLGAMSDTTPPIQIIAGKEVPQAPLREQVKVAFRATADKSMYWCRNFAFITGVFGGSECLVEKYRGKHDVWNSVASGCITGAALQAKQGPQAAAMGCGGFAAFSLVIDSFMGHY